MNTWKLRRAAQLCALSGALCLAWLQPAAAQCLSDSDCPAERPHCTGFFGVCRECLNDDHCPPLNVCNNNGVCQFFTEPRCGNGILEAGEQCDDGNTNNNDDCVRCANARCGDGYKSPKEDCDPPSDNPFVDCSLNCTSTLYKECQGEGQGTCNRNQICGPIQSPTRYCWVKADKDCTDGLVAVFNAACLISCEIDTGWGCEDGIHDLRCVSRRETLEDDNDGICVP